MNYQESLVLEHRRRELVKESQRRSLYEFFKGSWAVLEPGRPLALNWHQEVICEYLQLVSQGHVKRLLINIAPRHLKSNICSVAYPCWEWIQKPWLRYLCLSYTSRLANKLNLKRRALIQSDWYQNNWSGSFELAGDHNLKTEFSNNFQGQMYASSFGGTVTGEGGERIIVDDPHNPDLVESDVIREATLSEFNDSVGTRLNDPATGAVIVIAQRVHDLDVSGHVLAEIGGYHHLCLPTECESPTTIIFPLSGKVVERQVGDLLHPARFGVQAVLEAKQTLGSYKFSSRHQQSPAPAQGGMIEASWFQRYDVLPPFERIVQSWDTSSKSGELNAPWCCLTWGVAAGKYYLVHCLIKRMEYPAGLKAVKTLAIRYRPSVVLIEDKSTGSSVIQQLRLDGIMKDELGQCHSAAIIAILPDADKLTRISVESPAIESGRVFLPRQADWLSDYESSLVRCPKGLMDPVDATSQFLKWIRERSFVGTAIAPNAQPTARQIQRAEWAQPIFGDRIAKSAIRQIFN